MTAIPTDELPPALPERRALEYAYADADGYVFLDPETFDEVTLPGACVGDRGHFLAEGCRAEVVFADERPLRVELPACVELTVADVAGGLAVLDTGLKLRVPAGVAAGDVVAVDTRTAQYRGRPAG